jgi:hypothetical protein
LGIHVDLEIPVAFEDCVEGNLVIMPSGHRLDADRRGVGRQGRQRRQRPEQQKQCLHIRSDHTAGAGVMRQFGRQ